MQKFLFVSRHQPTSEQVDLAAMKNVSLIHVGDLDAFADDLVSQIEKLDNEHRVDGIVSVHPRIALAAWSLGLRHGSFRNVNRAPVGAPPQFSTDLFKIDKP